MRLPWATSRRAEQTDEADEYVAAVRTHLRVLLNELEATLRRIEDKRQRGLPGD